MQRRTFMAAVSALLSNAFPTLAQPVGVPQADQRQAMRAAWESLTWANFTGQALVVDV